MNNFQGDLYTWGWNTNGQLGITDHQKVIALPAIVDFKTEDGNIENERMTKVACGNDFTICLSGNFSHYHPINMRNKFNFIFS